MKREWKGRYTRVKATDEELATWRQSNPGRKTPNAYRYECTECGTRLWGSGLGIGSHNRVHTRENAQEIANFHDRRPR